MTDVRQVNGPDEEALAAAEEALAGGGVIVLPTDTVYGVGARPDVAGATDRLFEAKHRPRDLTLPVLVASTGQAEVAARLDDRARALAVRFWPGGLTLVLPRTDAARGWDLGTEGDTVGIRVPDHPVALALLHRTGPLAVTSANRSGEAPARTCEEARAALGDAVGLYLCAGPTPDTMPSTVVDLAGPEPRVLREGVLAPDAILAVLP